MNASKDIQKELEEAITDYRLKDILTRLAPHAILVDPATPGEQFSDLKFVVSSTGLKIGKKILPNWKSIFPKDIKTFKTKPTIELMQQWYGPSYRSLVRQEDIKYLPIKGIFFRTIYID